MVEHGPSPRDIDDGAVGARHLVVLDFSYVVAVVTSQRYTDRAIRVIGDESTVLQADAPLQRGQHLPGTAVEHPGASRRGDDHVLSARP